MKKETINLNITLIAILLLTMIFICVINTYQKNNITSTNTDYLSQQTTKTIYLKKGDEESTSGDGSESSPYQSLYFALEKANSGDTIKLVEDIVYRQQAANETFKFNKKITLDGNSNTITFVGSNLEILAPIVFKNLTLNIIPDGAGTTKIYVSGNEVTFNNVSTLISQAQSDERPTLIGGSLSSSKTGTHTKINILNGNSETRFRKIIAGKENADSSIPVTINIDSEYAKVDNGIDLGGMNNYKVTGEVNINTNSKNIKKIDATNSTDNNITIEKSTIYNIELINIKNLTLKDNASITLKNLPNIKGDLELKQGTELWINSLGKLEINNLKGTGDLIISTDTNLLIKNNIIDSANIKLNGFESDLISNLNKIYIEVLGTINSNTNVSLYNEYDYYLINKEGNKYRLIENNGFDKNNIKKIEINTNPSKLTYKVGDTIDIKGLILKLTDKNNKTMLVDYTNIKDYNITYSPTTKLTTKDNIITIQLNNIKTTIPIVVKDNTQSIKDSGKYTPTIEDKKIIINEKIDAKSFITNNQKLPSNTIYAFEKEPNFTKEGKQPIVVVITYPDKSKDILSAYIIIEKGKQLMDEENKQPDNNEEKPKQDSPSKEEIPQVEEKPKEEEQSKEEPTYEKESIVEEEKETNNEKVLSNKPYYIFLLLLPILIVLIVLKYKNNKKNNPKTLQ